MVNCLDSRDSFGIQTSKPLLIEEDDMVRFLASILTCCIMVIFMGLPVQAEWWNDPKIKQSAGLSDKQIEAMNKVFTNFKEKRSEAGSKFRSAQTQLGTMLAEEKFDETKVRKALDEAASLHSQAFREMAIMKLEVRKLLTSEQLKKILAEYPDIFSTNRFWTGRGLKAMKKSDPSMKEKKETTTPTPFPGQGQTITPPPAPSFPSGGEGGNQ
jgi:uncharacterized membrane protein